MATYRIRQLLVQKKRKVVAISSSVSRKIQKTLNDLLEKDFPFVPDVLRVQMINTNHSSLNVILPSITDSDCRKNDSGIEP
ncbi:hypothetical protein TNCV_4380371 [Trichonephila clavipes]|nr:hypothetical protein TNCV_4380371 [Trichonephila clavipes]